MTAAEGQECPFNNFYFLFADSFHLPPFGSVVKVKRGVATRGTRWPKHFQTTYLSSFFSFQKFFHSLLQAFHIKSLFPIQLSLVLFYFYASSPSSLVLRTVLTLPYNLSSAFLPSWWLALLQGSLAGERRQPVGGGAGLPESVATPLSRRWPRHPIIFCCADMPFAKGQTVATGAWTCPSRMGLIERCYTAHCCFSVSKHTHPQLQWDLRRLLHPGPAEGSNNWNGRNIFLSIRVWKLVFGGLLPLVPHSWKDLCYLYLFNSFYDV